MIIQSSTQISTFNRFLHQWINTIRLTLFVHSSVVELIVTVKNKKKKKKQQSESFSMPQLDIRMNMNGTEHTRNMKIYAAYWIAQFYLRLLTMRMYFSSRLFFIYFFTVTVMSINKLFCIQRGITRNFLTFSGSVSIILFKIIRRLHAVSVGIGTPRSLVFLMRLKIN